MDLFEVKVGYKPCGKSEAVKELYLVEAMSFTEAEAKVIGHVASYADTDVEVVSEKKSCVKEVLNIEGCGDCVWYRGKVAVLVDVVNEKYQMVQYYVPAKEFGVAMGLLGAEVKRYGSDCRVVGLQETGIVELVR